MKANELIIADHCFYTKADYRTMLDTSKYLIYVLFCIYIQYIIFSTNICSCKNKFVYIYIFMYVYIYI